MAEMTSDTFSSTNIGLPFVRATGSQLLVPTLVTLLAAQSANAALIQEKIAQRETPSTHLALTVNEHDLLSELVRFHQKLAASQRDLPEDAARLLRENLWQLYE